MVSIWQKIASKLGFNEIKIKNLEMSYHFKEDATIEMFTQWLEGVGDLQPATWSTLIESLRDVNLTKTVALLRNLVCLL